MPGERRLDRQTSDEPSLRMSSGVLCLVLFAMFAIARSRQKACHG
jgi:hypothetical protein